MSESEEWPAGWAVPYTMTSRESRAAMISAVRRADERSIEGAIVECGVWRAGNIIIARKMSPGRTCWLYDTYAGMTVPGPEDISRKGRNAIDGYNGRKEAGVGWCEASLPEVRRCLMETGTLDETHLRFIVGDVCDTLRDPKNLPDKIAVLRLDTDWYSSTKIELKVLYPRLEKGGVLIVDDYGHWRGARQAVDEFFKGTRVVFQKIDYTAIQIIKS